MYSVTRLTGGVLSLNKAIVDDFAPRCVIASRSPRHYC